MFAQLCCFPLPQDRINGILKERWYALTDEEKQVWKGWESWDAKRYEHQLGVYEKKQSHKPAKKAKKEPPPVKDETVSVPKKSIPKKDAFSVPKKKK